MLPVHLVSDSLRLFWHLVDQTIHHHCLVNRSIYRLNKCVVIQQLMREEPFCPKVYSPSMRFPRTSVLRPLASDCWIIVISFGFSANNRLELCTSIKSLIPFIRHGIQSAMFKENIEHKAMMNWQIRSIFV